MLLLEGGSRNELLSKATNELSKEKHTVTKWKSVLERGAQAESSRVPGSLAFGVASGQSSCLCPYLVWLRVLPAGTCISQTRWFPAWGFLGNWWDILWAGISSLLSAPPKFSSLVLGGSTVFPYRDLLLWDNSCKWLLSCLAKVGGFSQQPIPYDCPGLISWKYKAF